MFAVIAQTAPDAVAEVIELWHLVVGLVAPLIIGTITNAETRDRIRKFLPILISVGASAITWVSKTDVGYEIIALVPTMWVIIKMAYETWSTLVSIVRRDDMSINDVLFPESAVIK